MAKIAQSILFIATSIGVALSAQAANYQYRQAAAGVQAAESPSRARSLAVSSGTPVLKYNIFTALNMPTSPVDVTLTIETGTLVTSDAPYTTAGTTPVPALSVGALPAGSTVVIINKGVITGTGGRGASWISEVSGVAATRGGDAIQLTSGIATTIDNTAGYIFGGGGGGQMGNDYYTTPASRAGGGGGAGGASAGGLGTGGATNGAAGTNGLNGVAGAGGTGTLSGGAGGSYGEPGKIGYCNGPPYACTVGGAGQAVAVRGAPLTFTLGNNTTQVKGAVN